MFEVVEKDGRTFVGCPLIEGSDVYDSINDYVQDCSTVPACQCDDPEIRLSRNDERFLLCLDEFCVEYVVRDGRPIVLPCVYRDGDDSVTGLSELERQINSVGMEVEYMVSEGEECMTEDRGLDYLIDPVYHSEKIRPGVDLNDRLRLLQEYLDKVYQYESSSYEHKEEAGSDKDIPAKLKNTFGDYPLKDYREWIQSIIEEGEREKSSPSCELEL